MILTPSIVKRYHIFLASPSDVEQERQAVHHFFAHFNRTIAQLWGVHFEVVDWENYSSIGVGHPQELITRQTLERFKDSLALVVGIMGQRFGSPTGKAESGTEEEFRWALAQHLEFGFPEIKWFFKRIERFVSPPDPDAIVEAADQWRKVRSFREEVKSTPIYFAEYSDVDSFREVFERDLTRWLSERARPWISDAVPIETTLSSGLFIPDDYYKAIESDFHRLDITGIDNDRAFEIPLSEIYVRLRVMLADEFQNDSDSEPIDVQTALIQHSKLVVVGDPGSGKSTLLKYVALTLARSVLNNNPTLALEKLSFQGPLPIPIFVSCWDLSDFLRERDSIQLTSMLEFLAGRMTSAGSPIDSTQLESLLNAGSCCLLFDGLDEVATESGRAVVSRLLEDSVRQFSKNRFLVSSRVRAYTGDAILKGEFVRCDIQSFDSPDRTLFLLNWVALLFKTSSEHVLTDGTDPNREFQSLMKGIESNDRIRALAVNPLLLTVIAIVHWNRKRLPEQRVDLYDECVDVLLGQRKEAEHIQTRRKIDAFDEQLEQYREEERPWVRKRFAEIALRILQGEGKHEETTKSELIKLLMPRFIDRGAKTSEAAEIQAAQFLSKQELRSGLLVSRKEHSYRFVHLTFQEYLAAWHLSNQEFEHVVPIIEPRLWQQRWFEPMQLLGSEWAKQSDEKLDRYLYWLLQRRGKSIVDRAPVVALCANIVRDCTGVAELTPNTRRFFEDSLKDTLDAFQPTSDVPANVQLEILEALGKLGSAVKPYLIDATKSKLNEVRSQATELLFPHLSDDELFGLEHLLNDHSKVPIKIFLRRLLSRDPTKAAHWLNEQERFSVRLTEAFVDLFDEFIERLNPGLLVVLVRSFIAKGASYDGKHFSEIFLPARARLISYLGDMTLTRKSAQIDREPGVRKWALTEIALREAADPQTWKIVRDRIDVDGEWSVRAHALDVLTEIHDNPETWQLVRDMARLTTRDFHNMVRRHALSLLGKRPATDKESWEIVHECATQDSNDFVRREALELLPSANTEESWDIVRDRANLDSHNFVWMEAIAMLLKEKAGDPRTLQLVRGRFTREKDPWIREELRDLLRRHNFSRFT